MKDIVERMRELEPSMTVGDDCKDAADEIERLRAKVEAMEKQEPTARTMGEIREWVSNGDGTYSLGGCLDALMPLPDGTSLYALPGAQPEPITDQQIQDLLRVGNPTDEECRLIRMGWHAAMQRAAMVKDMAYIVDALDIAQVLTERSNHHPRILEAYNKGRAILEHATGAGHG